MNNYLVIDIENDNTQRYQRKAGNFMYDKVIAIGLKAFNLNTISLYLDNGKDGEYYSNFEKTLQFYNILVGHNIKHDLLFLWDSKYLHGWLQRGGQIWDTQLVEYILSNFQSTYPALRDIAVHKYGCKPREKLMEKYWSDDVKVLNQATKEIIHTFPKGTDNLKICQWLDNNPSGNVDIIHGFVQTSIIPKELVLQDVENDVLDTEKIYLEQRKQVERRGLQEYVKAQNEYLLSTIEMEYNGMKCDKRTFMLNKLLLESDLAGANGDLYTLIERYWR